MTNRPPIRTFHARHGRMGAASWQVLHELGPRFHPDRRDPARAAVVEIGCGFGEAAVAYAEHEPALDVIAVDVHRPGIVSLLRHLAARAEEGRPLSNLWIACDDAVTVLAEAPPSRLMGIHAFFPDPWPKTRHHKRRLIRPDLVSLLADRLDPGGVLRFASDVPDYVDAARAALERCESLAGGPVARPRWRPLAGYEAKAHAAGHEVTDLAYERINDDDAAPRDRHADLAPGYGPG